MKPKIMFITPALGMGGAERWILTLVKYFNNFHVEKIINLSGKNDNRLLTEALLYTKVINNKCDKNDDITKKDFENIDVIISWGYTANLNLAKEFKCISIDVSHSDPSWNNQKNLTLITECKSKYHVGVSKVAASSFSKHLKTEVIYNGIDTQRIKPTISREEQRKIWGIENKKVVFFSGRLSEEKNPFALINSIKHFDNSWIFVFIENGSLLDIVQKLDHSKIKIVKKTENIGNYFNASDVFVMTSNVEGMPLSLLEAWYSEIPVVTTEYNSFKELQNIHGEINLSVPIGCDSLLLYKKINEAYNNGKNHFLVKNAKNIVNNNYTAEIMTKNWENYIFKLLGK